MERAATEQKVVEELEIKGIEGDDKSEAPSVGLERPKSHTLEKKEGSANVLVPTAQLQQEKQLKS